MSRSKKRKNRPGKYHTPTTLPKPKLTKDTDDLRMYEFDPFDPLCQKTDRILLQKAKDRGYYNASTPYNKLFNSLFYEGGRLSFRSDVDLAFRKRAMQYLKCLIQSFEPSHKDKEAVCALMLSEIVDV